MWRWMSRCSEFTWSIGCWGFPWKRQKHQCPSVNRWKGKRFITTSHEVSCGFRYVCLYLRSFMIIPLMPVCVILSDLRGWFSVSSTQTVSLHHAGGQWPQPRQVVWYLCICISQNPNCDVTLCLCVLWKVKVHSSQWAHGWWWGVCECRTCFSGPTGTAAHRKWCHRTTNR